MPRRSTDFNDIPDTADLEVKSKKKSTMSDEERFESEKHERRVRLVGLKSNYPKFKEYLSKNEDWFKRKYSDADKECLRRTCYDAMLLSRDSDYEDSVWFDRIFGPYIDPRQSRTIPASQDNSRKPCDDPYKRPIDEQLKWFSGSSYDAFWKWLNNPETQVKLKGRSELKTKMESAIDVQRRENRVLFYGGGFKEYDPSDEAVYAVIMRLLETTE